MTTELDHILFELSNTGANSQRAIGLIYRALLEISKRIDAAEKTLPPPPEPAKVEVEEK